MLWACCLTYLLCFFWVQNGISHSWEGVMRPALKPSQLHYRWGESAGGSVCIGAGKCEPSSSSSLQFRCHWELHRETCSFHGKACREECCSCHGKCLCLHRVGWYSIVLKSGGRFPYKPKNKGQAAWQWRKSTTKKLMVVLDRHPGSASRVHSALTSPAGSNIWSSALIYGHLQQQLPPELHCPWWPKLWMKQV